LVPSILRQFLTTLFLLVIFAHCSKTWEKEKIKNFNNLLWGNYLPNWWVEFKLKGHWKNWRVGQSSIVIQIWQVKKEVGSPSHCTKDKHSNPHHFFSFFFLYSCSPMYPYYLAWSTENQPTRFSLHIQLQLLCWKTMLLLHTDPNAKKAFKHGR
jgi:hypothetical protein